MGKIKNILAIVGPTASGKNSLAYLMANKIDSEIISADSRQIYKLLDIGTAKPTLDERKKYKHHLIDKLNLNEIYSAGNFEKDAKKLIDKIFFKNKLPIVVGGTGLYINALIYGLINIDNKIEIRKQILNKLESAGSISIYNELKKVDPESAKKYLPQQTRFVVRALEVFYSTGIPISTHHKNQKIKILPSVIIGLDWDRNILYERINNRVELMLQNGFINEVNNIISLGFDKNIPSLNTVGYKEAINYLNNEISKERFVELMKQNSRRYAKRQLTWFRKMKEITWFKIKGENELESISDKIFNMIK